MAFGSANAQHNGLTAREVLISGDYNGNPTPVAVTSAGLLQTTPSATNLTTLTTGQVTATTTSGATAFVPALAGRKALVIKNSGSVAVSIGNTGVTAGTGHILSPGDSLSLGATDGAAALAYFVITTSSTALCSYAGWS